MNLSNHIRIMEVCGSHTVAIAKSGLRELLPKNVELISGPGCPVCVTSNTDIDTVIALAQIPKVIIATFGDMVRVPGSTSSLMEEKSKGADVRIVYSPLDCLKLAAENPEKEIAFIAVGFETTAPSTAALIKRAKASEVKNLSILCLHKNIPNALRTLLNDDDTSIDAFILPGHVSTIIGCAPYEFMASEFKVPGAISGFDPKEILLAIHMLLEALEVGEPKIMNAYTSSVADAGNPTAMGFIDDVFEERDTEWRGLGIIEASGYEIREEFAQFDSRRRFDLSVPPAPEIKGCECGSVLKGVIAPNECTLFGMACTPQNPVGPCMVSSEGSCAAAHRFLQTR